MSKKRLRVSEAHHLKIKHKRKIRRSKQETGLFALGGGVAGLVAWGAIGTLGVATGGMGFAVGAAAYTGIGTVSGLACKATKDLIAD